LSPRGWGVEPEGHEPVKHPDPTALSHISLQDFPDILHSHAEHIAPVSHASPNLLPAHLSSEPHVLSHIPESPRTVQPVSA
jgi:hypothetical protein